MFDLNDLSIYQVPWIGVNITWPKARPHTYCITNIVAIDANEEPQTEGPQGLSVKPIYS